ncbi:MAG: 2-dehydro-3-deoxyphosphooctonate aldolase [Gammaproteobacteria bacterium]|nr:MAG: 2-dehydro-3-deoxyphosphooctonate aldolase [Deltaproteobacteria bacterium]PIE48158.1 MAG: 2-dehydro-3-deoxyphosphooctonate aldolase [Gammaproteobacteria bacterium]
MFLSVLFGSAFGGTDIPKSKRSINAVKKVTPIISRELTKEGLSLGSQVYIRIFKEEKVLELWVKSNNFFKLFKSYPICTFSGNLGPKTRTGDYQAPEGFYFVKASNLNPYSNYHLSFNLGYPNRYEREKGYTGGALMVHGSCVSIGCYAMTDPIIEEIYTLVEAALSNGQPYFRVHAFPFRMTNENMEKHSSSKWFKYWENLQEGYLKFEEYEHIPPNVEVNNGKYIFNKPES